MVSSNRFFLLSLYSLLALCAPAYVIAQSSQTGTPILSLSLTLMHDKPYDCKTFDAIAGSPFSLETINYQCDSALSQEEFYYLTELKQGVTVTSTTLYQAVQYLFAKEKFSSIQIARTDTTLTIKLESFWTFEKVVVHGIWFGAEQYKQRYAITHGAPFDQVKHAHAIASVREFCRGNGYLHTQIKSSFEYQAGRKTVTVHLYIALAKQSAIHLGKVSLIPDESITDDLSAIKQKVRNTMNALDGKPYTKQTIEIHLKKIKLLLEEHGYLHTTIAVNQKISKKGVRLDLTIEIHMKREFVFLGNNFFSRSELIKHILLFGRSAWLLPPSILAEEIARLYQEHGFWHVTIQTEEEADRYFFLITEGPQETIATINFENGTVFGEQTLKRHCFGRVATGTPINKKQIQKGCEHLIDWYLKHGYMDVKLTDVSYNPVVGSNHQRTIALTLHEGVRYSIKQILVESDDQSLVPELQSLCRPYENHICTPQVLNKQKQALEQFLHEHGFLHAVIRLEIEKNSESSLAELNWHVYPGAQTFFGKTIVRGTAPSPFGLLKQQSSRSADMYWNPNTIKQQFDQLKQLEVFESLSLSPGAQVSNNYTPILVSTRLDDPFEVRVRAGLELEEIREYQTMHGMSYRAGGTFIAKNPFDRADLLRMDIELARLHREIIMRYQRPWPWYIPVRSILQIYSIKHDQGFFRVRRDVYNVKQNGFLFGIYHNDGLVDVGLNCGSEWMQTSINKAQGMSEAIMSQIANAINFDVTLLNRQILFAFAEPTLFITHLDDKVNPHRGYYTLCTVKGMVPLNQHELDSYFVRFLISHTMYIPLWQATGVVRARFGHIFHKDFQAIMPSERFYLGGVNSLRSYDTDLAPPLGIFQDDNGKFQAVPQGGKSMANLNLELRVPLTQTAGATILQDFGFLSSNDFADFEVKKVLAGSGFGAWYATPLGMLRFDFAFKWSTIRNFEKGYAWFLTLSQSF